MIGDGKLPRKEGREREEKKPSRSALTTGHLEGDSRSGEADSSATPQHDWPASPKEPLRLARRFSPLSLHTHSPLLSWGFAELFWVLRGRRTEECLCHTNPTICSSSSANLQGWVQVRLEVFWPPIPSSLILNSQLEAKLNYFPQT